MADRAHQCAAVLPLKQVHNHRVIAGLVQVPLLLCKAHHISVRATHPVRCLDVWLAVNAIQVLMESVEEEGQEFLTVLLCVAHELRRITR